MKLKEPKVFTLQEAKGTLPLVQKIVADIIQLQQQFNALQQRKNSANSLQERKECMAYERQLLEQYQEYHQELASIGCRLKDPQKGIVGYYWDRGDGLVVELHWQYGDPDIYSWHEIGSDILYSLSM